MQWFRELQKFKKEGSETVFFRHFSFSRPILKIKNGYLKGDYYEVFEHVTAIIFICFYT